MGALGGSTVAMSLASSRQILPLTPEPSLRPAIAKCPIPVCPQGVDATPWVNAVGAAGAWSS